MSNTVTGTDVIRVALQARVRKLNTASLARDLGLSSDTLDQVGLRGRCPLGVIHVDFGMFRRCLLSTP